MWPAVSLGDVFDRATSVTDASDPTGERLVSLVFAPPGAELWGELSYSVAYLDRITGSTWDLFFVGVPAVAKRDSTHGGRWSEFFQPKVFAKVGREVYRHHANALEASGLSIDRAWRYSGGSDLVSVLCHHGAPDWLSLTAARLDGRGSEPVTLSEVAARQGRWQDGDDDPMFWADPLRRGPDGDMSDLTRALTWTGAAMASGITGDAAYDLVQGLLSR